MTSSAWDDAVTFVFGWKLASPIVRVPKASRVSACLTSTLLAAFSRVAIAANRWRTRDVFLSRSRRTISNLRLRSAKSVNRAEAASWRKRWSTSSSKVSRPTRPDAPRALSPASRKTEESENENHTTELLHASKRCCGAVAGKEPRRCRRAFEEGSLAAWEQVCQTPTPRFIFDCRFWSRQKSNVGKCAVLQPREQVGALRPATIAYICFGRCTRLISTTKIAARRLRWHLRTWKRRSG